MIMMALHSNMLSVAIPPSVVHLLHYAGSVETAKTCQRHRPFCSLFLPSSLSLRQSTSTSTTDSRDSITGRQSVHSDSPALLAGSPPPSITDPIKPLAWESSLGVNSRSTCREGSGSQQEVVGDSYSVERESILQAQEHSSPVTNTLRSHRFHHGL